jgi:hypothetical protein
MKAFLISFILTVIATAGHAHDGAFAHPHLNEPNWMPVLFGLLVIAGAAAVAWLRK